MRPLICLSILGLRLRLRLNLVGARNARWRSWIRLAWTDEADGVDERCRSRFGMECDLESSVLLYHHKIKNFEACAAKGQMVRTKAWPRGAILGN